MLKPWAHALLLVRSAFVRWPTFPGFPGGRSGCAFCAPPCAPSPPYRAG